MSRPCRHTSKHGSFHISPPSHNTHKVHVPPLRNMLNITFLFSGPGLTTLTQHTQSACSLRNMLKITFLFSRPGPTTLTQHTQSACPLRNMLNITFLLSRPGLTTLTEKTPEVNVSCGTRSVKPAKKHVTNFVSTWRTEVGQCVRKTAG